MPVSPQPAARRSCLSVPASSERMVAKALASAADEVVIDLEDAVAPAAKDEARAAVAALLSGRVERPVSVRVNGVGTPWCHRDLEAIGALAPSIVLPKVESAGDVAFVERLLAGVEAAAGAAPRARVQALIETAAGLSRIEAIAGASPRLEALILGYADLAASLGRADAAARTPTAWAPAQHEVLRAARTNGLQAIDGPFLGTAVDEAFEAAATWTRDLGFDGKWAIHPRQLDALNALFTPGEAEVAHAQAVLDALAAAESEGAGAVALEGQMLDEAIAAGARRTLARAGR